MRRPGVAGWRCARGIPGRSLRGPCRGQHQSRLGAGVSIGAINSAIIAGNEPAERVGKLRAFWQEITANPLLDWAVAAHAPTPKGSLPRALFNQLSAAYAVFAGASGFFTLRQPAPWLYPHGALESTSF